MSEVSLENSGQSVHIRVPMQVKRRNGRKVVILPDGTINEGAVKMASCNRSLAGTIARAYHWDGLIAEGKYRSVSELAKGLKMDRSFVARVLRLTLLAPDIVRAILAGDEPDGLTYHGLCTGSFPVVWEEQRKTWGFAE